MTTEKPANCIDALVRGAAEEDRQAGLIPRVAEHRAFVQGIVERMERKDADRPARPAPAPTRDEAAQQIAAELAREDDADNVLGGEVRIERRTPSEQVAAIRSKGAELMAKRIRLLNQHPEWATRIKEVNPLTLNGAHGPEKRKHAEALVMKVIADSERVFGPWWKEPVAPVYGLPILAKA